jgi:hypothetical protein
VAVEPSKALEQYVSGNRIGHEHVGIDVQRLLAGLRRNHDNATPLTIWTKRLKNLVIEILPILIREAGVVQHGIDVEGLKRPVVSDCVGHCRAQPEDSLTTPACSNCTIHCYRMRLDPDFGVSPHPRWHMYREVLRRHDWVGTGDSRRDVHAWPLF